MIAAELQRTPTNRSKAQNSLRPKLGSTQAYYIGEQLSLVATDQMAFPLIRQWAEKTYSCCFVIEVPNFW